MPLYIISSPSNAGPLETVPPLIVNGQTYSYAWDKPTEMPEDVAAAARDAGLAISPADDLGNGDAAGAEGPGGNSAGSDTPNPLDHDGDGQTGGSLPQEPPALSGKTKAELLAIAAAEGVGVDATMTNAAIAEAITAARAAA